MNLSNGELIIRHNNIFYVCDLEHYSGTYMLSESGQVMGKIDSIMWFAAADGDDIYYSNQEDNDYLYCLDTKTGIEKCVLEKPCCNITVFRENVYFLSYDDGIIYQFNPSTSKRVSMNNDKALSFILDLDFIYYSCEKGLKTIDLSIGHKQQLLTDCIPICLNISDKKLIFADKSNDFALSYFDLTQNKLSNIGQVRVQSIAASEDYIYASNFSDNHSIIRIDISTGEYIRFCGEKADKLHIIDDYIYFQNKNDKNAWYKMPLSGGRNVRLMQS